MDRITIKNQERVNKFKQNQNTKIIAFTGASSCGKTYLAKLASSILGTQNNYFSQDNYYRNFKEDFSKIWDLQTFYKNINFDDPVHFNIDKLLLDLEKIRKSNKFQKIYLPQITFGTSQDFPYITEDSTPLEINDVIITEGVYSLQYPGHNMWDQYDLTIFVETNEETRKHTWVNRNTTEGRYFNESMWQTTVDSYNKHILPTKSIADIILYNAQPYYDFTDFFKSILIK